MRLTLIPLIVLGPVVVLAGCGGGHLTSSAVTVNSSANGANPKSSSSTGPQTSWMVVSLPDPQVTPGWRNNAPGDCQPDPTVCAQDHRFWEEWDFSAFRSAIDSSFQTISAQGRYKGVMLLMPLADSPTFWNNVTLMYTSATNHGLAFQAVVFPRYKYGDEPCYLYASNAPPQCATVPGSSTALAYQETLKLMNYVENLGSTCGGGASNRPFSIWYGWNPSPGYDVLSKFWNSLPTKGCNLRASYVTWLDTPFSSAPEVAQLQNYVVNTLKQPYHVNTELYNNDQITQNYTRYAPYQTIVTGFYGAPNSGAWAQGMCSLWQTASQPANLGVWNFSDRDIYPVEQYGALINGAMANASTICSP